MTLTWCQNWSFLHILHVNVTSLTQILWYLSEHTCRYIEWMNLIAKKLVMEFFYIVISVLEKWSESISCCIFQFCPTVFLCRQSNKRLRDKLSDSVWFVLFRLNLNTQLPCCSTRWSMNILLLQTSAKAETSGVSADIKVKMSLLCWSVWKWFVSGYKVIKPRHSPW